MEIYEDLLKINRSGKNCVLITVVEKKGHGPAKTGFKMILTEDGKTIGTVGGGNLEYLAIQYGMDIFRDKTNKFQEYYLGDSEELIDIKKVKNVEKTGMICGGAISLYFEYHGVLDMVYLFGAGHVGEAILYHINKLSFTVVLIDSREDLLRKFSERVPVFSDILSLKEKTGIIKESFFIIATHSHVIDYSILKTIITEDVDPKYIGIIASKKKSGTILLNIKKEFGNSPDIDRIHTPIGLDIGGSRAEEIAISIIAELQSIKYNKTGMITLSLNLKE